MGNNMTPELLAPAGSPACLMAALNQGADAVYLGLDKFNARMNAENFTLGNLKHYVRLCRIGGAKIYVALNTLVKDSEFNEAFKTAVAVFGEGADAVIVQDLGLAYRLKAVYPSAALHISTQAGIHNVYGAAFAKALGASRVILARETALADIQAVAASGIETEVFIHGALCSSVSGVCYYSSLASGLSGNRGRCLQLCRKKYDKDGTGGYFLSVKDLCLIGRVRELLDAGVACFKIEGRMRRPEYTAQAVKSYRAALDAVRDGKEFSAAAEIDALKRVYNRGDFTEGYLSTPLFAPKIVYDKIQNHIGVHAGQPVREGGRRFYVAGNFLPSDGFKLLYKGEEAGSAAITGNGGGKTHLEANTDAPFDELRLTLDARQSAGLLQSARDLRAPVHMRFILKAGVRSVIELSSRGIIARAEGAVPEKAANKPVDAAYVRESAEKCGELFVLERLELDTDGHAFMSRSALNALRRDGIDALADALWPVYAPKINTEAARQMPEYKNIRTLEQADLCIFSDLETYDVLREKFEIIVYAPEDYNTCAAPPGPFWLSLPPLALESDLEVLKQAVARLKPAGLYANNIYGVYFARELGLPLIAGYMLNIANAWGATALQMTDDRSQMTDKGHNEPNLSSVHFPLERGGGEAGGVWRHLSSENKALIIPSPEVDGSIRYAYGRFPLMTLAHCPEKNDCARCSGARTVLIDDKGKKLQVRRIKMSRCIFRLLDAEALELPARERAGRGLLFDFTGCGIQEITETLNRFAKHEERKNKNYFRKTV